jgi:hypothetical protein
MEVDQIQSVEISVSAACEEDKQRWVEEYAPRYTRRLDQRAGGRIVLRLREGKEQSVKSPVGRPNNLFLEKGWHEFSLFSEICEKIQDFQAQMKANRQIYPGIFLPDLPLYLLRVRKETMLLSNLLLRSPLRFGRGNILVRAA